MKNTNPDFYVVTIAKLVVADYARAPLPKTLITHRQVLCTPGQYAEHAAESHLCGKIEDPWEFYNLPVDELTKPIAKEYTCPKLGPILAVHHNSNAYVRVLDIARISGLTREQLRDFIDDRHFVDISTCGAGDATLEFVEWAVASLFCIANSKGQLLIAWVEQVILNDLRPLPDGEIEGIFAGFLHALIPNGLDFPAWKTNFILRHPEVRVENGIADIRDFSIPLIAAKAFALEDFNIFGMLAYILICEAEVHSSHQAIIDSLPLFFRVQPDPSGQVDARILHFFLKVETPFEVWMQLMIESLGIVGGLDYFTTPSEEVQERITTDQHVGNTWKTLLTPEAAIKIGISTPTARGRLIVQYFIESGIGREEILHYSQSQSSNLQSPQ